MTINLDLTLSDVLHHRKLNNLINIVGHPYYNGVKTIAVSELTLFTSPSCSLHSTIKEMLANVDGYLFYLWLLRSFQMDNIADAIWKVIKPMDDNQRLNYIVSNLSIKGDVNG